MITYKVQPRQTLLDAAIQATGTAASAMAIAKANGLSISQVPATGTVLTIPAGVATMPGVVEFLVMNNVTIGTIGTLTPMGLVSGGIVAEDGSTELLTEDETPITIE